jgi:hypothetical protein
MASGLEDAPAVDDPQRMVHPEAEPFQHGREVPWVDRQAIDRCLPAGSLQPRAVEEGGLKGMQAERLAEPRDRRRCAGERLREGVPGAPPRLAKHSVEQWTPGSSVLSQISALNANIRYAAHGIQ